MQPSVLTPSHPFILLTPSPCSHGNSIAMSPCPCSMVITVFSPVEGGHRAVLFSRLTGIQNKVYLEGLHFRCVFLWACLGVYGYSVSLAKDSLVSLSYYLWHPSSTQVADLPNWQQRPADGQHWTSCSVQTWTTWVAQHVSESWAGLWWESASFHLQWGVEGSSGSVQCIPADHTAW